MMSFQTILVPIDFSESSRMALQYGLTLATHFKGHVIAAHVVPESSALRSAFPTETTRIEQEQEREALQALRDFLPSTYNRAVDVQMVVRTGVVGAELLKLTIDEDVGLVVMGTHGRKELQRWFIGSVTERVLRQVPVPLLTVSHVDTEKHRIGLVALKEIVYATDLSESTHGGLHYAIALARATGAHLTVMHSVYYPDRVLWAPASANFDDERLECRNYIGNQITELFSNERLPKIPVDIAVVKGRPFEMILQVAAEREADLIVINLQSKRALERAFLGATAERVVRLAPIPVLSIPAP
jgi:nucleotide-binding universal stress UspA family protein